MADWTAFKSRMDFFSDGLDSVSFELSYFWTLAVLSTASAKAYLKRLAFFTTQLRPVHFLQSRSNTVMAERQTHGVSPTERASTMQPLDLADASEPSGPVAENESQYPSGSKAFLAWVAVGLSLVLVGLDSSILATAVPSITDDFKTIKDIGWYNAGFALPICAFQFMFGRIYYVWSVKWVFMLSIAIFELGSLLCGLSPTSAALVVGRTVQGLGCAGIVRGCYSMCNVAIPLRRRPLFIGVAGMVEEMSSVVGPLIGGILTSRSSWRWCFYINLPLGGIVLVIIGLFYQDWRPSRYQHLPTREKLGRLDLTGTVIFVPGMVSLLVALQLGGTTWGWSDPRIIVCFVVFGLLLALFTWWQIRMQDEATLPPRIVKQRSVLAGMWFVACNNGSTSVFQYYLPIYLQSVRGISAQGSGIITIPIFVAFMISILSGGVIVSSLGHYVPNMLLTSLLTPIALGLLTTLSTTTPISHIIGYSIMMGFGSGFGFQGPQSAMQSIFSIDDVTFGSACIQFAQSLGPAILVPAAQATFTGVLTRDLLQDARELMPQDWKNWD